jgi:hypothetical protein
VERNDVPTASGQDRMSRSLEYLRRRSQHRVWWNSARIAVRRGQSGGPLNHPPNGHNAIGKRV